ncbi:hypothetical protein [Nonomuraea insulae]|uniref:Uncharacterized protein n=1 Tax=Nonomuraea insulae TaxID=1616787 RepID=A0ABW1CYY2_9ACTN
MRGDRLPAYSGPSRLSTDVRPVPIGHFANALTRALLASDGSTTLLLQALTGGPITASLRSLAHQPATHLPADLRAQLRLADGATAIVRHSHLLDQQGTPVSRNEVIASSEDALLRSVASDPTRPVGLGLIAHDIDHSRRLYVTGLTRWDAELDAASKAYLISVGATPFMYVWETYNPEVIPPGTTA